MGPEYVQISAARVISIEPDAAVALDAAVHLMIDEGAEVLVLVRPFFEPGPAVGVAGHDRHILEVTLATFVADRAVMRVVHHKPFDDACAEGLRLGIVYGDAHAICQSGHAGHHDPASRILVVLELLHRALAAGAYGMHRRMPAEIRQIETQGQACLEEVLLLVHLVGLIVDEDSNHFI
jgi:hypothetical protein